MEEKVTHYFPRYNFVFRSSVMLDKSSSDN